MNRMRWVQGMKYGSFQVNQFFTLSGSQLVLSRGRRGIAEWAGVEGTMGWGGVVGYNTPH